MMGLSAYTAELAIWGLIVVCIVLVVISIVRGRQIRIEDTVPTGPARRPERGVTRAPQK